MGARCIVLVPYLTHIEPACERGLRELERRGIEVRRYAATAAIDRTRCEAATGALTDGFDELMWVDSDIAFDPDDVEKLRASPHALIGGGYAKKGVRGLALQPESQTRELTFGEGGGPVPVRYIGTGFLLVRRAVFDAIQKAFSLPVCNTQFGAPMVPYFLPMVVADPARAGAYRYLGEDYAFCERARQVGHLTIVDTSIRLGHVGPYTYGWEDAGQVIERVTGVAIGFPED